MPLLSDYGDFFIDKGGTVQLDVSNQAVQYIRQSSEDGQQVHGYTTNLTETIDDNKPSLIVSAQTEPVTFSDCNFLQEAIENAERVTKETVKDVYADGAYQSPGNREFAQSHEDMNLKTGRMQGGRSRHVPIQFPYT